MYWWFWNKIKLGEEYNFLDNDDIEKQLWGPSTNQYEVIEDLRFNQGKTNFTFHMILSFLLFLFNKYNFD